MLPGSPHIMLHFHRGNSLVGLADALAEQVSAAPLPPLEPEIVVVQSLGMARWLTLQLAQAQGVCARVEFPFPRKLFSDLVQAVTVEDPEQQAHRGTAWQENGMTWTIMDELLALEGSDAALGPLYGYLHPPDQDAASERTLRAYQISAQLARLFDQYLVYRPDLIREWSMPDALAGLPLGELALPAMRPEGWQRALWERLTARNQGLQNPVESQAALLARLNGHRPPPKLPARISLFGITTLPSFYLELLPALARHIPVHLYLPQPTHGFWADIVSARKESQLRQKASRMGKPMPEFMERGHPLLASWGNQGREFQELLLALPDSGLGTEHFNDPVEDGVDPQRPPTLLQGLQSDILNMRIRGVEASTEAPDILAEPVEAPLRLDAGDRSLTLHQCSSPLREVQVLRDQLLAAFEELPGLAPREIIVMAPDISLYTPHIETVFGASSTDVEFNRDSTRIPYTIADREATESNQVARAILRILRMAKPTERFTATSMLDLLEMPALRKGSGLGEQALERIRVWVEDLPVCWGCDAAHRTRLGLHSEEAQTWREGLDRLLLGYATGDHGQLLGDLAPYTQLGSDDWAVLGKFSALVNLIFRHVEVLGRDATLQVWSERLLNLVLDLFTGVEAQAEMDLRQLREVFAQLPESGSMLSGEHLLPLPVVEEHLVKLLQLERHAYGFISGGVTFCALKPMRSIPFRVICLLGMSDRAFPRQEVTPGFDLMARSRRPGDRSRRDEDRYLFLEALLATQERFILLYSNALPQEAQSGAPSPLISELLDHIEQTCTWEGEGELRELLMIKHPLHSFNPRYFGARGHEMDGASLFSYNEMDLAAARRKQRGAAGTNSITFLHQPLEPSELADAELERVSLDELLKFLRDPCQYFLKKRLEVALGTSWGEVADSESFSLDGLGNYKLRDWLLREGVSLTPERLDYLYRLARATGKLPHGTPGQLAFGKAVREVRQMLELDEQLGLTPLEEPLTGTMRIADTLVEARLDQVYEQRLAIIRHSLLNAGNQLHFWYKHVALNILDAPQPEPSILVGHKGEKLDAYVLPRTAGGTEDLHNLLKWRQQGLSEPLRFVPEASLKLVELIDSENPDSERKAFAIARQVLKGTYVPGGYEAKGTTGPAEDTAWREICFPHGLLPRDPEIEREFQTAAQSIWQPYLKARTRADELLKTLQAA